LCSSGPKNQKAVRIAGFLSKGAGDAGTKTTKKIGGAIKKFEDGGRVPGPSHASKKIGLVRTQSLSENSVRVTRCLRVGWVEKLLVRGRQTEIGQTWSTLRSFKSGGR